MNAFTVLGLEVGLNITDEAIKQAYESNLAVEDALEARNRLLNPSERLKVWMTLQEITIVRHSAIPEQILSLFSDIATLTSDINTLHQQRLVSQTVLGQALLDKKLFQLKPQIDALAHEVKTFEAQLIQRFGELESNPEPNLANQVYQSLKFINKWKLQLDESYNRLIVS